MLSHPLGHRKTHWDISGCWSPTPCEVTAIKISLHLIRNAQLDRWTVAFTCWSSGSGVINPEVDAAAAVQAVTDVPYGWWRCPYPWFFYFLFYFFIQWQEVHCVIYSSINRGCNKNLKSHHATEDHLHMKNNAIEFQETKVGRCKFQQLLGRCVCDDIWTRTHTDQPIHLLSVIFI